MKFDDERELEKLIVEMNKEQGYCAVADEVVGAMVRQVKLPGYGIADIVSVCVDADPGGVNIVVNLYELKNTTISCRDVAQISRYYTGIKRYINNVYLARIGHSQGKGGVFTVSIRGLLVGGGYADNDVCYLIDSIPWLECYHFSIGAKGVNFELSSGWYNKEEAKIKQDIKCGNIDKIIRDRYKEYLSFHNRTGR